MYFIYKHTHSYARHHYEPWRRFCAAGSLTDMVVSDKQTNFASRDESEAGLTLSQPVYRWHRVLPEVMQPPIIDLASLRLARGAVQGWEGQKSRFGLEEFCCSWSKEIYCRYYGVPQFPRPQLNPQPPQGFFLVSYLLPHRLVPTRFKMIRLGRTI